MDIKELIEHLEETIRRWTNTQDVLLHAGEMTAQEKRTVMAVLNGFVNDLKSTIRNVCPFKPGDTVVFDSSSFNPDYWDGLSEEDRIKYYGPLGYGREKLLLFTFICEQRPQFGHCVLVNMENQQVETMRHINDFRLVSDEEC